MDELQKIALEGAARQAADEAEVFEAALKRIKIERSGKAGEEGEGNDDRRSYKAL